VAVLVNSTLDARSYEANFDATELPSGTYFYHLTGNGFAETGKMQLIK
jgi:hypothetical protein